MSVLEGLRGGLIVSIQPPAGSVLDDPSVIALLAACAVANGAVAVRIEGAGRIRAVRARVDVPVIGIRKRAVDGFDPYITPAISDVEEVLAAGAGIVAADATLRPRPDGRSLAETIATIHSGGALAMADCATEEEARCALRDGADILATTLCGYTPQTRGTPLPAIELVRRIATLGAFAICEGGIGSPLEAAAAFGAGADAIVVGTAISDLDLLIRRFVEATPAARESKT